MEGRAWPAAASPPPSVIAAAAPPLAAARSHITAAATSAARPAVRAIRMIRFADPRVIRFADPHPIRFGGPIRIQYADPLHGTAREIVTGYVNVRFQRNTELISARGDAPVSRSVYYAISAEVSYALSGIDGVRSEALLQV